MIFTPVLKKDAPELYKEIAADAVEKNRGTVVEKEPFRDTFEDEVDTLAIGNDSLFWVKGVG